MAYPIQWTSDSITQIAQLPVSATQIIDLAFSSMPTLEPGQNTGCLQMTLHSILQILFFIGHEPAGCSTCREAVIMQECVMALEM